jgi:hypothetical protein
MSTVLSVISSCPVRGQEFAVVATNDESSHIRREASRAFRMMLEFCDEAHFNLADLLPAADRRRVIGQFLARDSYVYLAPQ